MSARSLLALLLAALGGSLSLAIRDDKPADSPRNPRLLARTLPGVQKTGEVMLPNQWSLRPAGRHLPLGDFPVNLALHPDGKYLAILHAGLGTHEVVIVQLGERRDTIRTRVSIDQAFYGLAFAPDGKTLYASGGEFEIVHSFAFDKGLLGGMKEIRVAEDKEKFVVGGITLDTKGETLFVCGPWGNAVRLVPVSKPGDRVNIATGKDSYPYTSLLSKDGKKLYVSLWGKSSLAVIDLETKKVAETWKTDSHPTELALSPDGKSLFVSCANSTRVTVLDTTNGKSLESINCALYPQAPSGNTPSSLCLTPDGKMLFVANADANNVAVLNVEKPGASKSLGFIPAGWYPTSVRYDGKAKRLYIANGKGLSSRPNVLGSGPNQNPRFRTIYQYIGGLMRGTLSTLDLPTPDKMADYTKEAYKCSPLRKGAVVVDAGWTRGNPIPRKLGEKSPIKHCIYIIKENRTYDQVFGDIPEGNGDPNLCLFPAKVTPNHHRLAKQFVLLDNFYVEGEVSADGHEWSMGAYATDFVEKLWPLNYRGSPKRKLAAYPSEGSFDSIARPAGGYIWDRAKEGGVTYRSYGEWIANGKKNDDGTFEDSKASVKALEGHFDPKFRGYDLDYPDVKRAERFITELKRFEKEGKLPQLIILRLPNDHTYGTRPGKPTPTAMVADNDLALGMVVEAVTRSKFWKETAIFVLEDDAQNGPDHVDAHRSPALVISPYTKRKVVDSSMYSTSSMLRTMELILGLKPMSQFDAAARPMYNSFQAKADLTGYKAVQPDTNLKAINKKTAWGAKLSESFDLTKEDAADDLLFNEVIWRSVKGPNSPMPAPVRAAFFVPKK